jgi:hypothetical protein
LTQDLRKADWEQISMGVKYSAAAALLLTFTFGASVDSFALTQSQLMSLLASEGYGPIWRVDQGDLSPTYGRSVVAYEVPRQISDKVCASRQINLGVREATGAILSKQVTLVVALKDCQDTTSDSFVRVFGVPDDKWLADIAHAIALFFKSQSAPPSNVSVKFQDDAARELASLGASGRLLEIEQLGSDQAWAAFETNETKPRYFRLDLRFDGGILREILVSETFAGAVR